MEEDLDVIARGEAESEQWLRDFWFGAEKPGLSYLIGEENRDQIDIRPLCEVPVGLDEQGNPVLVRVGRYGPYIEYLDETASLPPEIAPDELDVALALEIIARKADDGRELGTDPESGEVVIARAGRFGPYVQLGAMPDAADKKAPKPKTASLFKTMSLDTITLEEALQLLALPRVVGADAEGNEITAQNGRYGPYIKKGSDSRSLETEEQIFTIDIAGAEALFAQPKRRGRQAKPPLADLGPHPETEKPMRVLDGRFGPYVTDGELNASLPRGMDPGTITMDEALGLLQARAEKLAESGGKPAKRAKKSATKKAAKTTAKKATKATKKATAKKATKATKRTSTKKVPPNASSETPESGTPETGDDPF
jgi:DNA topoisomerase-1